MRMDLRDDLGDDSHKWCETEKKFVCDGLMYEAEFEYRQKNRKNITKKRNFHCPLHRFHTVQVDIYIQHQKVYKTARIDGHVVV